MPPLPGICGPANRPCKISHSSTYPNQVGVYPSQFLPSSFTIWHAVFASNFPPALATDAGTPPFGLPIAGLIGVDQFIPNLGQTHNFQSHHYIIFAKTANRINVAHVITQNEIDSMGKDGRPTGIGIINVGEYVFEAVAVTDQQQVILNQLTEEELAGILESGESESDRLFRKLFEQPLPPDSNRLIGVQVNKLGIEYRMDNGSDKSHSALDQSGIGDLNSASYRDGSSKYLEVDLMRTTNHVPLGPNDPIPPIGSLQASERTPAVGDTIYVTYVAITKHYIRQRINISWQVFDGGSSLDCVSIPLNFGIVNYRFYEWDMEPELGQTEVVKLAGWRAVESFNANTNFIAMARKSNGLTYLADFLIGGPTIPTIQNYQYLPAKIKISDLVAYQANPSSLPSYQVNSSEQMVDDGAFHISGGVDNQNPYNYTASDWYVRGQFEFFEGLDAANNHVFYNVHPKALRKRDIDKFGIDRQLAQEIEKDIQSGKNPLVPFMDDPNQDVSIVESLEYLSASNTLFQPVLPVSSYTNSNLEAICGSLGSFPTNPANGINTYHSFESNIITEKFDVDTRVLVERNFAVNAAVLGPQLITIEGRGGARGSVSCICDPSKEFAFVTHNNEDDYIVYNSFRNSHIQEALRQLEFRPESQPSSENINTNTFEKLIGPSVMAGDIPGYRPGRAIAISAYSNSSVFIYKTSNTQYVLERHPGVNISQISPLDFVQTDKITINVGTGYYQVIEITYDLITSEQAEDALLFLKTGESIVGFIDTLTVKNSYPDFPYTWRINCQWMECDKIEIIGPRISELGILQVTVIGISENQTHDFLYEQNSHSISDAQLPLEERLTTRSVFFDTDVTTIAEDENSNLYTFFNDADGGISCVSSKDYGDQWHYYYGIVEKLSGIEARDPFIITNFKGNHAHLFFLFGGKIMCKKIDFNLFQFQDANLIERFESDIFVPGNNTTGSLPRESLSIYSSLGKILRRQSLSYVAAGDLSDILFLEVLGYDSVNSEFDLTETRIIESSDSEASEATVRKTPFAIGSYSAFTNADINNSFFSAYKKDNGELKLWFLGICQGSVGGGKQLQCRFSNDDGQNWYDMWEFINYGYNRLRSDPNNKTQFIDQNADGSNPQVVEGTNPLESNQEALFGINVHWSRLRKHKIEGGNAIDSESIVLEIDAPYLFLQTTSNMVFLFYIYQQCLLCKIFSDDIFSNAITEEQQAEKFAKVKKVIERSTRSNFIDGYLNQEELYEEIQSFYNQSTNQIMTEGNILFRYQYALTTFGESRSIPSQRICAYELPNGQVRVFYKNNQRILKSALWNGTEFWCEEFLQRASTLGEFELPEEVDAYKVTGGFGENAF